jgi:WD40 repeat protein
VEYGKSLGTLGLHPDWVRCVAFAPGSNLLASGGDDGCIHLWDTKEKTELAVLSGHQKGVRHVAFSRCTLLSASWDETIRLWDVAGRCERGVIDWRIGRVNTVAFSPDGMTAAAGGHDHSVIIWDVDSLV